MRKTHPLVVGMAVALAPLAAAAGDAESIADALLPVMAEQGAVVERDVAVAALQRQIDALKAEPTLAGTLPRAFAQAARLAATAESPATRGMMLDLTRESLATGAALAGDPAADPLMAAWQKADPLLHETSGGAGLAQTDIDAIARLRKLAGEPEGDAAADVEAEWQRLSASGPATDLIWPGRFNAWADGTAAAWDDLTPDERRIATSILTDDEVPPAEVLRKVTGTEDFLGWLAAYSVPMSEAERSASPELSSLIASAAFAGALREPIVEAMTASAGVSAMSPNSAAMQLFRLNNAMTAHGSVSVPGLMTGGY